MSRYSQNSQTGFPQPLSNPGPPPFDGATMCTTQKGPNKGKRYWVLRENGETLQFKWIDAPLYYTKHEELVGLLKQVLQDLKELKLKS